MPPSSPGLKHHWKGKGPLAVNEERPFKRRRWPADLSGVLVSSANNAGALCRSKTFVHKPQALVEWLFVSARGGGDHQLPETARRRPSWSLPMLQPIDGCGRYLPRHLLRSAHFARLEKAFGRVHHYGPGKIPSWPPGHQDPT